MSFLFVRFFIYFIQDIFKVGMEGSLIENGEAKEFSKTLTFPYVMVVRLFPDVEITTIFRKDHFGFIDTNFLP